MGNIVQQAFDTDETQLFCIQAMFSDTDQLLKTKCLSYLIAKVDSESKRLFGSEAVQQRTSELSNKILQTREIVAQYFSGMDDANYEKERDSLSTKIGPFCEGLSKNNCIAAAAGGALDPFAEQLAALIFARIHPKGIQ
ncbi:MAG: hypothetical protein LH465_08945 [Sphingomonas bacterium]|nr:hypothetical protein [Sphingomonas bacterium]